MRLHASLMDHHSAPDTNTGIDESRPPRHPTLARSLCLSFSLLCAYDPPGGEGEEMDRRYADVHPAGPTRIAMICSDDRSDEAKAMDGSTTAGYCEPAAPNSSWTNRYAGTVRDKAGSLAISISLRATFSRCARPATPARNSARRTVGTAARLISIDIPLIRATRTVTSLRASFLPKRCRSNLRNQVQIRVASQSSGILQSAID